MRNGGAGGDAINQQQVGWLGVVALVVLDARLEVAAQKEGMV
jgi:hypothetical protein